MCAGLLECACLLAPAPHPGARGGAAMGEGMGAPAGGHAQVSDGLGCPTVALVVAGCRAGGGGRAGGRWGCPLEGRLVSNSGVSCRPVAKLPHECAPGGTRTPNRPGRNRLLYPLSYGRWSAYSARTASGPFLGMKSATTIAMCARPCIKRSLWPAHDWGSSRQGGLGSSVPRVWCRNRTGGCPRDEGSFRRESMLNASGSMN